MKYLLFIHQGDTPVPGTETWEALPDDDKQRVYADYQALGEIPGVTPGQRLQPPDTATTVRVQDGETLITDGPFVELKEAVGGWLTYEGEDLDAAIAVAGRIPAARMGGAIEIRPFVEAEG